MLSERHLVLVSSGMSSRQSLNPHKIKNNLPMSNNVNVSICVLVFDVGTAVKRRFQNDTPAQDLQKI